MGFYSSFPVVNCTHVYIKIIIVRSFYSCDISNSGKFVRKNVTLPEWLSARAEKAAINFSQTLQESLYKKLGITAIVTA